MHANFGPLIIVKFRRNKLHCYWVLGNTQQQKLSLSADKPLCNSYCSHCGCSNTKLFKTVSASQAMPPLMNSIASLLCSRDTMAYVINDFH